MYTDIGKKIMILAEVLGVLSISFGIVAWICGLVYGIYKTDLSVCLSACMYIVWGFLGYVATWLIYGFGHLVDDIHRIRRAVRPGDQEKISQL